MKSDLKHIYHDKYNDIDSSYLNENKLNDEDSIEMPTGWSFICLDETINYYTDNFSKDSSKA